jgi:type VI secretion system protein ImpJ
MPRKLVWTEGLFITQHHFQQLDRYHEANLNERLRALLPFDWGVLDIEIDERALAGGQFRLTRLNAVLPDGTVVNVGEGSDSLLPARAVEGNFGAHGRTLHVWVALAQDTEGLPAVDLEGKPGAHARYVRTHAAVTDTNTGEGAQQIAFARTNLRILFGDERRDAFEAIRVAELARDSTGAVVLKDTFIPPVLRVRSSPVLVSGLRRILAAMTARQRALSEARRQRSAAALDFQASDAAKFLLLNVVNGSIPLVSHIVDRGTASPEDAYLALAQLIGQLCTFAVDGDPTSIPKYNQLDLGGVFTPMFERAITLLSTAISERYVQIPLQKRDDGMYLGKIEDRDLLRQDFYLAVSGSMPEAHVRERLPRLLKVASWNHISGIMSSAVNGTQVQVDYRPPGALPLKPGITFLKLQRTGEFWNDISSSGTIAVFQPVEPHSVEFSLYAIEPQGQ